MRRRTIPLLIAASALVAVGLTACGSDSDEPEAERRRGSTTAAATTGAEQPSRSSIENKYGTTEITEAPERVVTVGLTEQDALLALGHRPGRAPPSGSAPTPARSSRGPRRRSATPRCRRCWRTRSSSRRSLRSSPT